MITLAKAQEAKPAAGAKPAPVPGDDLARRDAELAAKIKSMETANASTTAAPQQGIHWWSTTSAMTMSASVLVFGLLTLALASYVIRKGQPWEAVLKIFGTVLILVMTVFLIVAGYDDKQIAPAIGLLGTIAGYLLGKDVSKPAAAEKPKTEDGPAR